MSLIQKGLPLSTAAAKAGMSEPTGRKYRDLGKLPSAVRRRHDWRTRPDPFEEVWPEVLAYLERDPQLQAKTLFEEIRKRDPQRYRASQLRTLQRKVRLWRASHGAEKEVFFSQVYRPGEQGQSDFAHMTALGIVIAGEAFEHLIYHFVLPYSNWEFAEIAYSESFEALADGLQDALEMLGGSPVEHRTDCMSAATHELRKTRGRGFNERYRELLDHYHMKPSKIRPGKANENGDVEQSHFRLKDTVDQRLRLRGRRDFQSLDEYQGFLQALVRERNEGRRAKLEEELRCLRPLPARRLDATGEVMVKVTRWSTLRILRNTYSVPSRLIGYRLKARVHAREIELEYGGEVVEQFERLRGRERQRINYRHLIHSLIRKPGAFRRFVYQEALFPTVVFRKAYDALVEKSEKWADLEYLRILHLAATTLESQVEEALERLLAEDQVPEYEKVKALAAPGDTGSGPEVTIAEPDLRAYDELLALEEVPA